MSVLGRRLMAGAMLLGLAAGARAGDPPKKPGEAFLDALAIAKVNLETAQNALRDKDILAPQTKTAQVSDALRSAIDQIETAKNYWADRYVDQGKAHGQMPAAHPENGVASQVNQAMTELTVAVRIANDAALVDGDKKAFLDADAALAEGMANVSFVQAKVSARPFLDALAIAESNLLAAKLNLHERDLHQSATLGPVSDALVDAVKEISTVASEWAKQYPGQQKSHEAVKIPPSETDLASQLSKAAAELSTASVSARQVGIADGDKLRFLNADAALTKAIAELSFVQATMGVVTPPANSTREGLYASGQSDGHAEAQTKAKGLSRLLIVSVIAILLSFVAIGVVLFPVGPVKKLLEGKDEVGSKLEAAKTEHNRLDITVNANHEALVELQHKFKLLEEQAEATADGCAGPTKSGGPAPGRGVQPVEAGVNGTALEAFGKEGLTAKGGADDAAQAASLPAEPASEESTAAPKTRGPVENYNEVRLKKKVDRPAEFLVLYPHQTRMACANPSARTNGPFTALRLTEDMYGDFIGITEGGKTLVFPEVTYEFVSGRETLQGIFTYPDGNATTYKLVRAATVENRGDEWALTEQGEFQDG